MSKRLTKNAPSKTAPKRRWKRELAPTPSTAQSTEGSAGPVKTEGGGPFNSEIERLDDPLQKLISNMLVEGSTFEDVIEALNARGKLGVTLNAVQSYFQRHPEIQAKRARYLVKSGEALLATLGKDPKSAEARLARATFLTGYLKVRREGSLVTAKDAERVRMARENLLLKRRLLVLQKEKAVQALKYSEARTRFIALTQDKLKEEISKLQQEAKGRRASEPMGPEMLQKIQQLYGLASQPLFDEESAHASAKA